MFRPEDGERAQACLSLCSWHIMDPIRFDKDLRGDDRRPVGREEVRAESRYLRLQESSTAFWYQTELRVPFPPLPAKHALEQ